MAKKMIRVRAKPPFPCLRRGFVRQRKLLTPKGIDASRHGPFTLVTMISWYKKVLVEKYDKADGKMGREFQNCRSRISEQNSCLFGSQISELGKW